jgi:hypothetical protein
MEPKEQAELDKNVELLKQLNTLEPFQVWIDWVAKPVLEQLEVDLANADQLDEVVLRAKLKHVAFVKDLFYDMFKKL